MKAIKKSIFLPALIFLLYTSIGCGPGYYAAGVTYTNPGWAPPYYAGVRYYYLPDIEVYYDLSSQQFVYPYNGQWLFAASLPAAYGDYNLYNEYTIALDRRVFQPWVHHQYYVAHYPKYYYRTVYHNQDVTTIRGFNENEKKPVYWREEDKNTINNQPNKINNEPGRINGIEPNRTNNLQNQTNGRPEKKLENPQKTQPQPNYSDKKLGKPVRVKPQMRENKHSKKMNHNDHNHH